MAKSKKNKIGVIRSYVGNDPRDKFNAYRKVLGLTQRELLIKLIEELPPIKQQEECIVKTFKEYDVPELRRAMQQLIKQYRYELQEVQEYLAEVENLYNITKGLSHEEILQNLDNLEHSKNIDGSIITYDLRDTCFQLFYNAEPKPSKPETFPGVGSNSTKTTLVEYNTILWYRNPATGKRITRGVVAHLDSRKTTLHVYGITKKWQKGRDIVNEAIGDILPGKRFEGAELSRPELILVLNKLQELGLLV